MHTPDSENSSRSKSGVYRNVISMAKRQKEPNSEWEPSEKKSTETSFAGVFPPPLLCGTSLSNNQNFLLDNYRNGPS